jgi:hypothetical protein
MREIRPSGSEGGRGPSPLVSFIWESSSSVVSWDTTTQACGAQRSATAWRCGASNAAGVHSSQFNKR